jgi:broad specificity phosphatase PhoE
MRFFGLTAIGFAAALFAVGCGSDGNPSSGNGNNSSGGQNTPISLFDTLSVPSAANLPACDANREGRAFFVQNENLPRLCVKGTWRSAADSTDFSITCSDGLLHAVDKIANQPNFDVDTVRFSGLQRDSILGIVQNGPFIFGTSVVLNEASEMNFYRADGNGHSASTCVQTNDGRYALESVSTNSNYVKISATGFHRNMVTGGTSASPVTLSALTKVASTSEDAGVTAPIRVRNSVNVNILTQLEIPRIEQLAMNHIDFAEAKAQAEREIFAAFGIDTVQLYSQPYFTDGRMDKPVAEDLDMFGNSEYSAALFAISAMLQGDRSEADMMSLVNSLAEDIKGDGIWNDPNWKIKIADWVVGLDTLWKYNDIRNNVSSWGVAAIPNFERYMRAFVPIAYGFEACTDINAGQVTFVNQGQSALFANDYEHADHSTVRFICDVNSKEWRIAQPIEKDTAGFGPGAYDKEIREGHVSHDTYYIFDSGAWRVATPQEADGFTDLVEVYANLKPDEKAVFIIRHSERTDETGAKGHLTENGKIYARNLGKRLAEIKNEDFYYGYSGYVRTEETCREIAAGKGQQQYTLDILPYMDSGWFVKDEAKVSDYINAEGGWTVYSKYAFTGAYEDAFYDLKTQSDAMLKNEILANLSTMKRVSVMCTHDYVVVPLLAYVTDGHANVRYYEKWRWVNYLAGLAMIVSPDGSIRYVPVKGLESGTM